MSSFLPYDIGNAPLNGTITFRLISDTQMFNSPTIYSYVLFNGQMSYYTSGTFETANALSLPEGWNFDKVRLSVNGSYDPANGYTSSFKAFDLGTASPVEKVDYLANETKTTIYVYGQGTEPMYEEVYTSTNPTTPVSAVSYLNMGAKRLGRWENGSIQHKNQSNIGYFTR